MITIQVKNHQDRLYQIDTESQALARDWLFHMAMTQGGYGFEVTRVSVDDGSGSLPQHGSLPQRVITA